MRIYVATLALAFISTVPLASPAAAFDLASLFGGTNPRVDDCRSGTGFARCGSGAGTHTTANTGTGISRTYHGPEPIPVDDCGHDNSTPQGRVSLGGGRNGQGNKGSNGWRK